MPGQSSSCNSCMVPNQGMPAAAKHSDLIWAFLRSWGLSLILSISLMVIHQLVLGQDKQTSFRNPKVSKADTTKELDNTNGKGGTKLTITQTITHGENDVDEHEEIVYLDPKGTVRQRKIIIRYTGAGQKSEERTVDYGLNTGKPVYEKTIGKDEGGTITYFREERFKDELNPNGGDPVQTSGYYWNIGDNGKKTTKKYNPKTNAYEDTGNTSLGENNQVGNQLPVDNTHISYHDNQVFLGPAYMNIANSGVGNKGYGSFGATGEYSRYFTPHLGGTLDVGAYFHKDTEDDFSESYTQLNFTVGPTFIPFKNPRSEDKKLSGNLHALFGLSSIMVKESSGSYGIDQESKQGFTACVGGALDYKINDKFAVRLQADYTPTFFFKTMQNNARVSAGLVLGFGAGKTQTLQTDQTTPTTQAGDYGGLVDSTREKKSCVASPLIKELKVSIPLDGIAETIEEVANKIPRVEAKISFKPQVTVKQGEECCSKDQPPASYTEIKGGWEGSFEININLWGIPDLNYSLKLWPILIIAEFKCKLFAGPTGKISAERIGKSYGDLLGGTPRPDCKSCVYNNLKAEGFLRVGVKAGGGVKLFHWTPLSKGKAGFDLKEPDEEIKLSAEASVSIGNGFNGTYTSDKDCVKPAQGLHGVFFLGKGKANLKFSAKLGPLSFDPNFEIKLFDGTEITF
jgi:hypothetical protein